MIPFVITVVNPFGLSDWANNRSYDIWQHVEAVIYGYDAQKGRNALTIVYLDQAALTQMGQVSPSPSLSLSTHGIMIDDLLSADPVEVKSRQITPNPPAALFVDLLLDGAATNSEHGLKTDEDLDEFMNEIGGPEADALCGRNLSELNQIQSFECYLNRVARHTAYVKWRDKPGCQDDIISKIQCIDEFGGIPIFFADPGKSGASDPTERLNATPALRALDTVAATVSVNTNTRFYELVDPAPCSNRHHKSFHLTPAAALYAAYCVANPGECKPNPLDSSRLCKKWDSISKKPGNTDANSTWSENFDAPILVTWGEGVRNDSDNDPFYAELTEHLDNGSTLHGCSMARRDIWSLQKRIAEAFQQELWPLSKNPCFYAHSISYSDFLTDAMSTEQKAQALDGFPYQGRPNSGVRTLVLLGGQFGRLNDAIPTYANHAVPGIYYHAMALDNLITYGGNYYKSPTPIIKGLPFNDDSVDTVVLMFCFSFVFGVALVTLNSFARPRDSAHGKTNGVGAKGYRRRVVFTPVFMIRYLKRNGISFLLRQLVVMQFIVIAFIVAFIFCFFPSIVRVEPFDALSLFVFVFFSDLSCFSMVFSYLLSILGFIMLSSGRRSGGQDGKLVTFLSDELGLRQYPIGIM